MNHLNASGRSLSDQIVILDTRGAGPIKNRLTWLQTQNFEGINNDGRINLHGFDIRVDSKNDKQLHIVLVNDRPFEDTGKAGPFNRSQTDSNSTIEYFTTTLGSKTMTHKQTFTNIDIETPRHVAWVDEHLFMFTNAHSSKGNSVGHLKIKHVTHANLWSLARIYKPRSWGWKHWLLYASFHRMRHYKVSWKPQST